MAFESFPIPVWGKRASFEDSDQLPPTHRDGFTVKGVRGPCLPLSEPNPLSRDELEYLEAAHAIVAPNPPAIAGHQSGLQYTGWKGLLSPPTQTGFYKRAAFQAECLRTPAAKPTLWQNPLPQGPAKCGTPTPPKCPRRVSQRLFRDQRARPDYRVEQTDLRTGFRQRRGTPPQPHRSASPQRRFVPSNQVKALMRRTGRKDMQRTR